MMGVPTHLTTSVEKVVQPKIQLFREWGIEGEHLVNVLTNSPRILICSVEQDLLPKMLLLLKVFQSQDLFLKTVLKNPVILTHNLEKTLKPSLAFWERYGFNEMELARLIGSRLSLLQYSSLTPAKDDIFNKIGIDKGSKMYEYVLITLVTNPIERLHAIINNLQQCGLSDEEGFQLLRVFPKTLGLRKESVREKMDFIVNKMELPANSVVSYPQFLTTNLERVMKPRFLVWRTMKSMYGRKHHNGLSLHGIMFMSEKKFLSDVLKGRPVLYSVYEMAMANVSEVSSTG
ncbi:hypothetical protein KI387_043933 [Taxus chinensis]|uniref:Uncharacterized protein n=1 Tax=Taxus chinensis TaxID=29808 RepID=A0AA38LK48_TAXCH|nr:hypothetical protein KI387_043933 [Taxus chinensis]